MPSHWREIERALGADEPLPPEVRRYLWDVVRELNDLVDDTSLTPEAVAKRVLEVLELTGGAIGAYREKRREEGFGWLFDLYQHELRPKRGYFKRHVSDLAAMAEVTTRTLYRWVKPFQERRARKEK